MSGTMHSMAGKEAAKSLYNMESISNRGLANEVNGLSFLCPRWKLLKQRMQMGSL
jgi:hypothetical protein